MQKQPATQDEFTTRIPRRWMGLSRAAWIAVFGLSFVLWLLGTYANATLPLPVCAEVTCDPFSLSAEDVGVIQALGLPERLIRVFWNVTNVGLAIPFFAVAGVLYWRKPDDWMVLLVSFTFIFLGSIGFTDSDDALWRMAGYARAPLYVLYPLGWMSLTLLLFLFPDGRFAPRRRFVRTIALGLIILNVVPSASAVRGPSWSTLLVVATTGFGLASQTYRYLRVSDAVQRQQTKWVVLGLIGALAVMLTWGLTGLRFPPDQGNPQRIYALLIIRVAVVILITALPVTMAFSILRYRLWDIDVIIRRTLLYAVVTGVLGLGYFASVALLQALFRRITGQGSSLAIIVSTLAIAALFAPLRRRVQALIDRRFYRSQYNAQMTLQGFSERARDEVDLDTLQQALLAVVETTFKPSHASLWVREEEDIVGTG